MAFRGLRLTGALLALCLVAASVQAEDATPAPLSDMKSVLLPTTTNDFGAMLFALLQQQTNFIAAKEGADQEGSPLNLLTTLSHWAQEAQTALFELAAPVDPTTGKTADLQSLPTTQFYDPLPKLLNFTGAWSDIISNAHPDPVPENLILALTELPYGPQLDAALKNLPVLFDPVSKVNASSSFGSAVNIPGINPVFKNGGAAKFVTAGAQVTNYAPCFVSEGLSGVAISQALIGVQPRILSSTVSGVFVGPRLIEMQPRLIYVKPVGLNVSPQGINLSPQLISVSPKVIVSYPATPAAGSVATAGATGK